MSTRDELATILHGKGAYCGTCGYEDGQCSDCTEVLGGYADAILTAGYRKPRTITTREELDALPSGTAILDSDGNTNVLHDNGWVLPGSGGGYTSWAVAQALPVTVLYEPKP